MLRRIVKNSSWFILCLLVFIIAMTSVNADDGVLGMTPDGVYPITQSDITMVDEEIYIQMTGNVSAKVTCRFDFKNYGKAQTVLMGFPAELNETPSELGPEESIMLRNFTAKSNKGELPVELIDTIPNPPLMREDLPQYSKWYSFSVVFDEFEEVTLYHTYDVSFSYDSMGYVYMGYVLETGSLWKGPIGHAKVTFDMGENPMHELTEVYPNNFFTIEGNKLIWERSSFEPTYNLWITRNTLFYSDEWREISASYGHEYQEEAINNKIALFKTSPKAIREQSQKHYQDYNQLLCDDPISALYLKSALGLPDGCEKPTITECKLREHSGDTWYFDLSGTDTDGDVANVKVDVTGLDKYQYRDDAWRSPFYYNAETKQFDTSFYLTTEENKPFTVTFILFDAAGNFDTTSLSPNSDNSEVKINPDEAVSPQPTPDSTPSATPASESLPAFRESILSLEEGTLTLLAIGVIVVLAACLFIIIFQLIKTKRKGYILFILQIVFLGVGFIYAADILQYKDSTAGVMLSEEISLRIGLSAVCWAISMVSMTAGILMIEKDRIHAKNQA